ncbi:MAG: hypothetical protein ACXABY_31145, partial [Candidatus Thorarchaeota archaeon]
MKRLIKYAPKWSDQWEFSTCSSVYEVLPYVLPDDAGLPELRALASEIGFTVEGRGKKVSKWDRDFQVTHAVKVGTTMVDDGCYLKGKQVERIERLGLIQLPNDTDDWLPVDVACEGQLTDEMVYEISNRQFGDIDIPITINNETMMLIQGWDAFHCLAFMGYSFQQFMEMSQCESTIFSDEVTSCH